MSLREDIIGKVIEQTQAGSIEAERALALANQNIESAINLLKTKILVISGRIIAEYEDIFGVFLIKIFLSNNFIRPLFCFSRDYQITKHNFNEPWYELEKYLLEKSVFSDKYLHSLNEKMRDKIINSERLNNYLNKNSEIAYNADDEGLQNIVYDEIFAEFFNARLFIDVRKKVITQASYEWHIQNEENKSSNYTDVENADSEETEELKKNQQHLDNSKDFFVKSEPVTKTEKSHSKNFKKALELAIGEEIFIKIIPTNQQSSYICNILKLDAARMKHNKLRVKIINIDKSEKDCRIFTVELIPGIFSKIRVSYDTSIKINDNLTYSLKSSIIVLIILLFCVLTVALYFIFYLKR